jgi:4-hydroxybutyrate dehydrogenase
VLLLFKTFNIVPEIQLFDSTVAFLDAYSWQETDLILTSRRYYEKFFKQRNSNATFLFLRDYGLGEPNNQMVEKMLKAIPEKSFQRVFGIGGGSILDIAKLLVLQENRPIIDLFEKKIPLKRNKELVLVPTTCGTGSEVTNISIVDLIEKQTKLGLAEPELFANQAILIPELLRELPYSVFVTSSIDAFIHAIESFISPKATRLSEMFSYKAMEQIIQSYQKIVRSGKETFSTELEPILYGSLYAGIAFGNAGTGTVHAMSYPFSSAFHVVHGEANYVMFQAVFQTYLEKNPQGKIKQLNDWLAVLLDCKPEEVYYELDRLFAELLPKKTLHEYGMTAEQILEFSENVVKKQQRLLANSYVPLGEEEIQQIYRKIF